MIMNEEIFFKLSIGWTILAIALFPILLKIKQPYGRHTHKGWGLLMPNKLGWIIMEAPSLIIFSYIFLSGNNLDNTLSVFIFFLWITHYSHRTFIFPLMTKTRGKKIPVLIVVLGFFFNVVNATLNAYYLGYISDGYQISWITTPQFIIGFILFLSGMLINILADYKLISLRKQSPNGYKIPKKGLFEYISCPNHFGEIIEWIGFSILSWNLASLSFAVWTVVNITPRSLDHHKWYKLNFPNYPKKRKAILPFIV